MMHEVIHYLEILCPFVTMLGLGCDYVERNWDSVVSDENVRLDAAARFFFASIAMMLGILCLLLLLLDGGSLFLIRASYSLSLVWAVYAIATNLREAPTASARIASFLRAREQPLRSCIDGAGYKLAVATCVLELSIILFGTLVDG